MNTEYWQQAARDGWHDEDMVVLFCDIALCGMALLLLLLLRRRRSDAGMGGGKRLSVFGRRHGGWREIAHLAS